MYVLLANDHLKLHQFAGLEFEFFLLKKAMSCGGKESAQKRYTYKVIYNGCKIKITAGLNVCYLTSLKKVENHII